MSTIYSRAFEVVLVALAALATAPWAVSQTDPDREWSLEPRYFVGTRSHVRVEETTRITIRHPGGHKERRRKVREAELVHGIEEVGPEGDRVRQTELTLERVAYHDEDPLRPLSFDVRVEQGKDGGGNEKGTPKRGVDPRLTRAYALLGASARARVGDDAQLESPEGDSWIGSLLQRLYADRPEGRVRVGATWRTQETLDLPGLGQLLVEREYELAAIEERGVRHVARVLVTMQAHPAQADADHDTAAPYELVSCRGSGTRHIDLISGALTEEAIDIAIQMETETTTLVFESELTTTVRTTR